MRERERERERETPVNAQVPLAVAAVYQAREENSHSFSTHNTARFDLSASTLARRH